MELMFMNLISIIETFNYRNPGKKADLQAVRRLCSEVIPLYDPVQVELEE
jgi:hypothetical protein